MTSREKVATPRAFNQAGETVVRSPRLQLAGYTQGLIPAPPSFQLLGEDRFQDIEKIKTIGSSYMAVSGLSPEKQVKGLFGLNHNLWQWPPYCHIAEGSKEA